MQFFPQIPSRALMLVFALLLSPAMAHAQAAAIPIAGDVNGDRVVNALDVQLVINAALGLIDEPKADITHSGSVNAQDVQLVINAALGIAIDRVENGLADAAEVNLGTDPDLFDTSGDGIPDGVAVDLGLDPLATHEIDAELSMTPAAASLTPGESLPASVVSSFPYYDLAWEINANGVAEVDDAGVMTATGPGEATLTATDQVSGASASMLLAVMEEATGENGARAVVSEVAVDTGDGFPNLVATLEDGSEVPLGNMEYVQHLEDGTPDLSTTPEKSLASKSLGRPEQERISLDAWQSPIRHQRDRNTCSAFTVVAAMEAAYKRAGYPEIGQVSLSEQFIHHVSKVQYLYPWHDSDDEPTQDGYETSLGLRGNAGVRDVLTRVMRYGIPMEHRAPYQHSRRSGHSGGDYENTNQPGDFPRISGDRSGTITQAEANAFNMEQESTTFQIPGDMTFAPLPQEALEYAQFGIKGYVTATVAELRDPVWYEWRIAEGHELAASFNFRYTVDDDGVLHPRDQQEGESAAWHAMLIVGYDRTDPDNPYFLVKNSWGESDYLKLSYDFAIGETDGRISDANYITEPVTDWHEDARPVLYLGGWRLVRDGEGGLLDIHRLAQHYGTERAGGQDDNRLGAFFRLGNTHRVNGWLNEDGTAEFYIDPAFGNLPYGALNGDRFEAVLHADEATLLAGSYYDANEIRRPFYANKGDQWQGVARFDTLSFDSFLGRWEVLGAGAEGWVEIRSVDPMNGTFAGHHISPETPGGESFAAMQGTAEPEFQEIQFTFPGTFLDNPPAFDGQIHANNPGIISGLATANGEVYPMVLMRTGPATQEVEILTPEFGDIFTEGAEIPLECQVFEDGILVNNPPITWTLGEPQGGGGMIIGSGASAATKRGAGEHTIFANYTGQGVYDQVSILVVAAGSPGVNIISPSDGEFISDFSNTPFVHVDFEAEAASPVDGPLEGDAIRWYYREEGQTDWTDSGQRGSMVTLELHDTNVTASTAYEIKVEAEDSLGNVGADVIGILILGFIG